MGYILWMKDGKYEITEDDDANLAEYLRQQLKHTKGQERERILKRIKECEEALKEERR